jgi:hypothetical protein
MAKRKVRSDFESRKASMGERLRDLLHYDPDTGVFTRLKGWGKKSPAGKKLGSIDAAGYVVFSIEGVQDYGHRFAWLYMTGEWPASKIDHENQNRSDNRWSNIRAATQAENLRNRGKNKNNTSGFKGVSIAPHGRWRATIRVSGKQIHLGHYSTKEEAAVAYANGARRHHGAFANV